MALLSTILTWLTEALELPIGIKLKNPRPLDAWYGPYDSVADAQGVIPLGVRYDGMTIKVKNQGEFCALEGALNTWVPKGGTGGGGPLDVVDLDLNGNQLLITRRNATTKSITLPGTGGDPNADDLIGAEFDESNGKLTIRTADGEVYTVYIRNIGLSQLSTGLQNLINSKVDANHTHLASAITDFATSVQQAVAAMVQDSDTISKELNGLAGTLKLNVKANSISEGLLDSAVRAKLNASGTGTGLATSDFDFTYTAANPTSVVPDTTFGVLTLSNARGRVLRRKDYRLDLDSSPKTLTILGGVIEGDELEGVLLLGSVAPDPDPDPDPNPPTGTPAAPGTATESGTTSSVPVSSGYTSPAAYEAEPVTSAPPTSTAPAAPAMATTSGTTSSVPLVASYPTPDQYEAETV